MVGLVERMILVNILPNETLGRTLATACWPSFDPPFPQTLTGDLTKIVGRNSTELFSTVWHDFPVSTIFNVMSEHYDPRWKVFGPVHLPPTFNEHHEQRVGTCASTGSQKSIKGSRCLPDFLSRCAAHPSSSLLPPSFRPGAVIICSSPRHSLSSCSPKPLLSPSSSALSTSTP